MKVTEDLKRRLLHNHSTTNLKVIGLRPVGECAACDESRKGWQQAVEEGR